jgi:hypothetical protein
MVENRKLAPERRDQAGISVWTDPGSTLASLEAALHLVDHIDPALAADQAIGTVTATQRFQ